MPRVSKGTRSNRKLKPADLPGKFTPGFTDNLDGRSLLARALRQRFEAIAADLGGEAELSALKSSLLERLVWLEAMLCQIESSMARAQDAKLINEQLAKWIQAVNSFTGIATKLGLERSSRDTPLWGNVTAKDTSTPPQHPSKMGDDCCQEPLEEQPFA